MRTLTVRFIDEPGLVSRLIAWTTNSLWCHTEALSRDGRSWIGAHSGTGVEARPLAWCAPIRERSYALPVADEQYGHAMAWLESKVGTPYSYGDIVGLAVHRRRLGARSHRVICSALMTELLMAAGLRPLNVAEGFEYLITPETLHLSPLFIGRCIHAIG
jgi:hypothetical protein